MSGLVNASVIVAVAAVVIVRQFRARALDTDRRWWVLPVILAVVALREPGILDAHHRAGSAALLAAEVLIGLATGAGWAWTTRLWTAPDGVLWTKSTRASVGVWLVGIGVRAGLFALGAASGVHQHSSALMLSLAGTLLVRVGILTWRARSVATASASAGRPAPAYGADMRAAWKEGV
ncbi:DUF1453 domain-containing protein [Streptomyces sp. IBSBF 3136]|uniref:DUF1453 domain-containing protein n=1 Tax=Streptomyces sp. IBSBF 3136 TaxID=2903524 RepID=UPI002FDBF38F